jgi:lysophospholipase L1-like esterase
LNAAQVGATSNDIVPIARTILDHDQPTNLVVFAGNNEWFHWRPTSPKNNSEPDQPNGNNSPQPGPATRSLLATLAHSRALAAAISQLFDLLEGNRHHAAPQRTAHDDGFVEHHALFGTQHAIDNPLTPDRYDTTDWPETRQKYADQFRNNLATIVTEAQRRNVRVILMTIPFQYRLAPAWKQRQPLAGDPNNLELMTRLIHETVNLHEQKQMDTALKRIQFAIKIDPDTPVPHYLEAQLLESLDRPLEAEAAYARSREAMIGNLGSQLSINRVIREVAAKHNAELVDLRKIFDDFQHRQKRYFNAELIHDDCHPTPLAHGLIAHHLDLILIRP